MNDALFASPAMADTFSAERLVADMLRVEAALARASSRAGLFPIGVADAIAAACDPKAYDPRAILAASATAGTPAIPLVRILTERVAPDASRWVHHGATSQDVVDTALALATRDAIALLDADLRAVAALAASLAERHRGTVMAGRTLLQQASPITFGLKAARWLALVVRQIESLAALRADALAVQLGGAVGTLAALGDRGLAVAANLAEELGLAAPDVPWHAERDRIARVAATVGVVAAAMGKIAGDVVLLAQSEVGEVAERGAAGKGGSSALPHKRNPVDAISAVAASRLALGTVPMLLDLSAHEHERAAGSWQAEWIALPRLFTHTAAAVEHARGSLDGLEVRTERMRANLELDGGAVMAESLATALATQLGRAQALELVKSLTSHAARDGISLRAAANADTRVGAVLGEADVERALDPAQFLGSTNALIDRALASYRRLA